MLKAAAVDVCITPPIGVELAGYGPNRERYSTDIHDHLSAQALILDDGTTRVAILTADLLSVSVEFTRTVRQGIEKATGIPGECVMVTVSHSHTAPTTGTTREWGGMDDTYVAMAARHLIGAVTAATCKLQPAQLSIGRGEHRDLAWNRTGSGVIDPAVHVLRVDDANARSLAFFVTYACHPVTLGPTTTISADFPGVLRRTLQEQYPGSVVLFANGTSGDIDPITNREAWGKGTHEDVERLGRNLASDAAEIAKAPRSLTNVKLNVMSQSLHLAYELPSITQIKESRAAYEAELAQGEGADEGFGEVTGEVRMPRFWLDYYRDLERRVSLGHQPEQATLELQVVTLGAELAFVGIPAEVYAEQGLAIRNHSPFPFTVLITHANGSYGYLPPQAEYDRGSYTAILAAAVHDVPPFRAGVAEQLVEKLREILKLASEGART